MRTTKSNPPLVIDLADADDVHTILAPCPPVGQGVHHALLGAVSELALLGYAPEQISEMVLEWVSVETTPYEREIPDAIRKVFGAGDPRLKGESFESTKVNWDFSSTGETLELARGFGASTTEWECLAKLTNESPFDIDHLDLTTDDWLDLFYRDDDLLCIGEQAFDTVVQSKADWKGNVRRAQFISPNPFLYPGLGRRNDNVKERRYLVTEMDIAPTNNKGQPTAWGLILKATRIHPFDLQAAIILYLKSLNQLRLLSVVWSGKKSLHALWLAGNEADSLTFMKAAVKAGVDKAGWTRSQFARIYNPGYPEYQELFYLNPIL